MTALGELEAFHKLLSLPGKKTILLPKRKYTREE